MNKFKKILAVLLVSVVFLAAVPVKQDKVYADVTYVNREQTNQYWIDGLNKFLDRLYYTGLGRATDPDGRFTWMNHIIYDGCSGADLVRGILFSPEFLNKNVSNEEFVQIVYRVILDREADGDGLATWTAALASGQSRQSVIEGFMGSVEWANLCLIYGLPSGSTATPSIAILPTDGSKSFVTWLYYSTYARSIDPATAESVGADLLNFRLSGSDLAHQYFFSDEINNLSNYDFLVRLYRTVLDREPNGDFQSCLDLLNNGTTTREQVFVMATESVQWAQTCGGFGILR